MAYKESIILNKKAIIILIFTIIFVVIAIFSAVALRKKMDKIKEEKEKVLLSKTFGGIVKKVSDNGKLKEEISKGLESRNIQVDDVKIMGLDIDSDEKPEIIVYAENDIQKIVMSLEVNEDIIQFQDSYLIDSIDDFGYVYSKNDEKNYWYVGNNGNYTVIKKDNDTIDSESFQSDYFVITNKYNDIEILCNSINYNLQKKKLSAKSVNMHQFTNDEVLRNNNITVEEIPSKVLEFEQEEQERKILESQFSINDKFIHYGRYVSRNSKVLNTIIINNDGTGQYNNLQCNWMVEDNIVFTCNNKKYILNVVNNDEFKRADNVIFYYEEEQQ